MHRCFIQQNILDIDCVAVSGEEAAHMIKVLRFNVGNEFELCDNTGYVANCTVSEIVSKTEMKATVNSVYLSDKEPDVKIILYQGLSKGTKMDLVLQKATELGVYKIVPVKMEHSVVKVNDEAKKVQRWQKITFEAAKQCKRAIAPVVAEPIDYKTAMKELNNLDLAILPYEQEKDSSLKKLLLGNKNAKTVGVIIGPEGGFSPKEIIEADKCGISKVTLGKRILRTETAAITMLSVLMYQLDEFDK